MNEISDKCSTKYPIFFVHGTGFKDRKFLNYWGAIPKSLKKQGASVFYSKHDAWSNIEDSANQINESLEQCLSETKSEKVNIIAHSKGGIDIRYAIKKFNLSEKIASITFISTPNYGSKTIDLLFSILGDGFFKFVAIFVNFWFKLLGDKKPDFFTTINQFKTSYMEKFNLETPNFPTIEYQSFAGKMKSSFSDVFMWFCNIVVGIQDGENDGLVSVESAKWGNYRGILEGKGFFGISHVQEVDGYRTNTKLNEHKDLPAGSKTIRDFYLNLVRELKERNF